MWKPPEINWIFKLVGEKKVNLYRQYKQLPLYNSWYRAIYCRIRGALWILFGDAFAVRFNNEEKLHQKHLKESDKIITINNNEKHGRKRK